MKEVIDYKIFSSIQPDSHNKYGAIGVRGNR